MSREVCGYCWCPWGDDGSCGCKDNQTGDAMSDELPPLPEGNKEWCYAFTSADMRAYARAAIRQHLTNITNGMAERGLERWYNIQDWEFYWQDKEKARQEMKETVLAVFGVDKS